MGMQTNQGLSPASRPRTVREAADELGLSVHTVRAWVARRRIAHIRLGRAVRISAAEIERVLSDGTVPRGPARLARASLRSRSTGDRRRQVG
jgi:excisionase family DNA binding protein